MCCRSFPVVSTPDVYKRQCPRCGSPAIEGNGRDANGVRRWRCLSCGRAFNPATGTVFDGRKLPVADWTEFLSLIHI